MGALAGAMEETAEAFLGGLRVKTIALSTTLPPEFGGSFIQLVSPKSPVLIGLIGPDNTCYALGRQMLGMEPSEDLTESDMTDAMGEIINVAAGGLKTRLPPEVGSVELGLPLFLNGSLRASGNVAAEVATAQIGSHFCAFLVLSLGGRKAA